MENVWGGLSGLLPRGRKKSKNTSLDSVIAEEGNFLLIVIDYNLKKPTPYKGSAIFIHLTNNYKPTAGCIALNKKDLLILLKLINKKTEIKIS